MRTLEELRQFYDTTLVNELRSLETMRKGIARKLALFGILVAAAMFLLFASLPLALFYAVFYWGIFLIPAAWYVLGNFLARDYRKDFKGRIIMPLVSFIGKDLRYAGDAHISKEVFVQSGLFSPPDSFGGDDLVQGKIGETQISFSEIGASRGSGKSRTKVFKGLFFTADFNKSFQGVALVLPYSEEKTFGQVIGSALEGMVAPSGLQLVNLEDPEFERLFVTYASDQVEARYLLTTSLMQRIVDFRKKAGKGLSISFSGTKLFVAMPYKKDLFEPRLLRTVLDFRPVQEYFGDLGLAIGIVENLNLNTRIWGKQ